MPIGYSSLRLLYSRVKAGLPPGSKNRLEAGDLLGGLQRGKDARHAADLADFDLIHQAEVFQAS